MTQRGAGMDVDAGSFVGPFGEHSRQQRDLELTEAMGDPVYGHSEESRVSQDYFVHALGGGIAAFDRGGVGHDLVVDLGEGVEECRRYFCRVDAQLALDGAQQRTQVRGQAVEGVAEFAGCFVSPFRGLREESVEQRSHPLADPCLRESRPPVAREHAVEVHGDSAPFSRNS